MNSGGGGSHWAAAGAATNSAAARAPATGASTKPFERAAVVLFMASSLTCCCSLDDLVVVGALADFRRQRGALLRGEHRRNRGVEAHQPSPSVPCDMTGRRGRRRRERLRVELVCQECRGEGLDVPVLCLRIGLRCHGCVGPECGADLVDLVGCEGKELRELREMPSLVVLVARLLVDVDLVPDLPVRLDLVDQ